MDNMISRAAEWFNIMSSLEGNEIVSMPSNYRKQVIAAKKVFDNDISGLAGTVVDFMIKSACQQFKVESSNEKLNNILNEWANTINVDYSTYIPVGIKELAKQYFTERWKGSSNILLRCMWGKQNGMEVPVQMAFIAGEDIVIERDKDEPYTIDNVTYSIKINSKKNKKLPATKDETIYIRKPFESWNTDEPVPYIIKRGVYFNIEFMRLTLDRTGFIVKKAMKYIMHVIQGSENMETQGIDTYSQDDLDATKNKIKELEAESNYQSGVPVYASNWDTTLKHMIPDYELALKQSLFTAVTQRILNGLGLMEIERSSRKEDMLNPKPMIAEIENGVKDFASLLEDVLLDVKNRNTKSHPKYFKNNTIKVWFSPYRKDFLTKELMDHLRSAYDRGELSKETYASIFDINWNIEIDRRTRELENDIEVLMYPHVTQKIDVQENPSDIETTNDDKKGPEKKNFTSFVNAIDLRKQVAKEKREFEEAPYKTTEDLPITVKTLPKEGQNLWLRTFNDVYKKYKDEDRARKVAWFVVKKKFKKNKDDKWIKK